MHVFLPRDDHLERIDELGILPTVQNHPTYLGRNMEELWGPERATEAIPIRTLLDQGMRVGGGTDAPVVPWFPFESIWWMVTRETVTAGTLGPGAIDFGDRSTATLDPRCCLHDALGGRNRIHRTG